MNGVYDLGGVDGMGPVVVEEGEPVFHADWEKTVFALFPYNFRVGHFNLDQFRFGMEQIPPTEYLSSRYYEHWLHSVEHYLLGGGVVDPAELDARTEYYREHPDAALPANDDPDLVAFADAAVNGGAPAGRETDTAPKFAAGDRVRVRAEAPFGHTRRARYIRGHTGVIEAAHGAFIYPDAAGNGQGENPQHVYTVLFTAAELWGDENAEANTTSTFDVWEPYLEPAETQ
jgi:nitrile hydratase